MKKIKYVEKHKEKRSGQAKNKALKSQSSTQLKMLAINKEKIKYSKWMDWSSH